MSSHDCKDAPMHRLLRRPTFILFLLAVLAIGAMACGPPPQASESSLLAQVNVQRANAGAPPLRWCAALGRSAAAHSADQAARNTMTHTGSDGSDVAIRVDRNGYRGWAALGENVAAGYNSEAAVLTAWMNSAGHRANILSPGFTHVGSGSVTSGNGTRYWTQDFGRTGSC
jgi:uncharacterized protein YkwD